MQDGGRGVEPSLGAKFPPSGIDAARQRKADGAQTRLQVTVVAVHSSCSTAQRTIIFWPRTTALMGRTAAAAC